MGVRFILLSLTSTVSSPTETPSKDQPPFCLLAQEGAPHCGIPGPDPSGLLPILSLWPCKTGLFLIPQTDLVSSHLPLASATSLHLDYSLSSYNCFHNSSCISNSPYLMNHAPILTTAPETIVLTWNIQTIDSRLLFQHLLELL